MLSKQQIEDSNKCEKMQEEGKDMDCIECSCNVCIVQENILTLNELIKEAHKNAQKHGFWKGMDDIREIGGITVQTHQELINNDICTRLMLIVGEVAEAMEGLF